MNEGKISIRKEGQAVVIDVPRHYSGRDDFGFWFRVVICGGILATLYFLAMPRVLSAWPALAGYPCSGIIRHAAIIPLLGGFYLLHFMGFHVPGDDGTSYFLSLAFYSPRVIATPERIVIVKRWLLRTRTLTIPVPLLREFETNPWFTFVSTTRTVIVCDGLKAADGTRVKQAIDEAIRTGSGKKATGEPIRDVAMPPAHPP